MNIKKTIKAKDCPICSKNSFEELIDFGEIPFSDSLSENSFQQPKKTKLSFEYCLKCAFIRQKFPTKHNYVKDERITKHLVPVYTPEIVGYFKNKIRINDLIVEIGCNDGSFLDEFSKAGFNNLLGIEPSYISSNICKSKGHKIENIYFNKNEAVKIKEKYGSAKVIIGRYVLEHILDPKNFINSVKKLLSEDGHFFIEVPDVNNIIYSLRAQDLWDEHLNHFTIKNLEKLINETGFETNKILTESLASTNAILLWGSKKKEFSKRYEFSFQTDINACKNFKKNWQELCQNLLEKIKESKKPIISIGASHPQTNFLIFSGIGNYISNLIDDSPNKINKYVFVPKPIQIISTKEFLESKFSGTIIRTAFGYDNWMDKICKSVSKEIEIIYPYYK